MIETKDFSFEIEGKGVDDEGIFTGHCAAWSLDQGGDRIDPKAFDDSIRETKGVVPILWMHQRSSPVGVNLEAKADQKGLWVRGKLMLKNSLAQTARDWMKLNLDVGTTGAGLSIGYSVVD